MKSLNKFLLFILAIIIGLFVFNSSQQQMMPTLSFTELDGQQHQLADYKGKPILVIFWATDCPGCIQEMPELIELHQHYADKGLTMIGVAMAYDSPKHIQAMRQDRQLPYLITWDKTGEFAEKFNRVRVTPTHFLIDPQGQIVMRKIGSLNMVTLKEKLHNMGF